MLKSADILSRNIGCSIKWVREGPWENSVIKVDKVLQYLKS